MFSVISAKCFESLFLFCSPVATAPTVGSVSCYYLHSTPHPTPPLFGKTTFCKSFENAECNTLGLFPSLFFFLDSGLLQLRCDCAISKFAIPWTFSSLKRSALRPGPAIKVTIIRPRCISIMSETISTNSWDSSAISESALKSQRVCQKIELSYERRVYARKSNNLFTGSFEIPAL